MPMPKLLLVNPPIYDFTAYDFWMKPLGLLNVGGILKESGAFKLYFFDFLEEKIRRDSYGRGKFPEQRIEKPKEFESILRYYKRFGLPAKNFQDFLQSIDELDYVLIGSTMTYWYKGIEEVIRHIRTFHPEAKIAIGGIYATLCPEHAKSLGADYVIENDAQLESLLKVKINNFAFPLWQAYKKLDYGVIRLTKGCPFRCSYCASFALYKNFRSLPIGKVLRELKYFASRGIKNIAFYDDALLYKPEEILIPFLREVQKHFGNFFNFHTPNALNARFFNEEIAKEMLKAGFKTFFFGFESAIGEWRKKTGNKVTNQELVKAVKTLIKLGVDKQRITAYVMMGHPEQKPEEVEESIKFVKNLGIKVMLSEYSPVPKTRDFEKAMKKANLPKDEPLYQNKTAYPIFLWGQKTINRLKLLAKL